MAFCHRFKCCLIPPPRKMSLQVYFLRCIFGCAFYLIFKLWLSLIFRSLIHLWEATNQRQGTPSTGRQPAISLPMEDEEAAAYPDFPFTLPLITWIWSYVHLLVLTSLPFFFFFRKTSLPFLKHNLSLVQNCCFKKVPGVRNPVVNCTQLKTELMRSWKGNLLEMKPHSSTKASLVYLNGFIK